MANHLYVGDNLGVLRKHIADESVDLIYLDPPFSSNATYNVLFRSPTGEGSAAQIEAFDDTWHWGDEAETAFQEVRRSGHTDAATMLEAMRSFLGTNDMMAYLAMMAVRLVKLNGRMRQNGETGAIRQKICSNTMHCAMSERALSVVTNHLPIKRMILPNEALC